MTRAVKPQVGDPTTAAVEFLTVPGRAEKVLAIHHDDGRGRCAACLQARAPHPCVVARLALTAISRRRGPRTVQGVAHTRPLPDPPLLDVRASCAPRRARKEAS